MSNFPPGSDTDDAPWNDKSIFIECPKCDATGKIYPYEDQIVFRICKVCDGAGEIEIEKD